MTRFEKKRPEHFRKNSHKKKRNNPCETRQKIKRKSLRHRPTSCQIDERWRKRQNGPLGTEKVGVKITGYCEKNPCLSTQGEGVKRCLIDWSWGRQPGKTKGRRKKQSGELKDRKKKKPGVN